MADKIYGLKDKKERKAPFFKGFRPKWFFKTREEKNNIYGEMGAIGLSPEYMKMYQESEKKIEEYEAGVDHGR